MCSSEQIVFYRGGPFEMFGKINPPKKWSGNTLGSTDVIFIVLVGSYLGWQLADHQHIWHFFHPLIVFLRDILVLWGKPPVTSVYVVCWCVIVTTSWLLTGIHPCTHLQYNDSSYIRHNTGIISLELRENGPYLLIFKCMLHSQGMCDWF